MVLKQKFNNDTERISWISFPLAQELLKIYGSPLYVYNGDRLRHTIQHITQAVSYPDTQFCFASVTN